MKQSHQQPQRSSPNARSANSALRIIGGKWRGRKLSIADVEGLRPTGDRIRETLFNWLTVDLPGSRCLDLFAGTGALGLEALSRGAAHATLLEKSPVAVNALQNHLTTLQAGDSAKLIATDALQWLKNNTSPVDAKFDIVFIDPPFQADLWEHVLALLEAKNWLHSGSAVYIETPRDYILPIPSSWLLHREKQTGQVNYRLYYCN